MTETSVILWLTKSKRLMDKYSFSKRYLIILGALLLTLPVLAEVVTPSQAQKTASQFFGKEKEPQIVSLSASRVQSASTQNVTPEEPAYYIFNYPDGGWVIISGDDCLNPILGYSRTGSFQGGTLNDNLQYWMNGITETVDYARSNGLKPSAEVVRRWKFVESISTKADAGEEKILKTAAWDQYKPFNDKCPVVNGESSRSVSGCVATAMSILMRYHEYPEHGTGTIGGYTTTNTNTFISQYSIEDHYYDWSEMPATSYGYGGSWSVQQSEQVAQLVHDAGVAVEMNYSSSGSSTVTSLIPRALGDHFGYSKSMQCIPRSTMSLDAWFDKIRQSIKEGNPILYAGHDKDGGHSFICDGYSTTDGNMIHINWGWSGSHNGFFTLDLVVPGFQAYSYSQYAIFGAVPDPEGTSVISEPTVFIRYLDDEDHSDIYGMLHATPDGIRKDAQVKFYIGPLQCYSYDTFNTSIKVSLLDKDGNFRADIGDVYEKETDPSLAYICLIEGTIPVVPNLTDYFQPFFQHTDGSWEAICFDNDNFDESSVKCGVTFQPFVMIPEGIKPGDQLELKLSYAGTPARSITWYLDGTHITEGSVTVPTESKLLKAEILYIDGSKGSVQTYIGGEEE